MEVMTLIPASVVCFLSLATTAEVIPLDEVQRALDAGTVGQSQRVVISEDGTQWILEEVGPDLRTERVNPTIRHRDATSHSERSVLRWGRGW